MRVGDLLGAGALAAPLGGQVQERHQPVVRFLAELEHGGNIRLNRSYIKLYRSGRSASRAPLYACVVMKTPAGRFVVLSLFCLGLAFAEVTPSALFSDHMVLQSGMAVPVWGTACASQASSSVPAAPRTAWTTSPSGCSRSMP